MQRLKSNKNKLAVFGMITTAAYMADRYDSREIMDVTSGKSTTELVKSYDGLAITNSVTKDQINHDVVLSLATLDGMQQLTKKQINRLSSWQSWVIMPNLRKQLNNLTEYVCHEEQKYKEKGYFCCVHGTHKGAEILMRTILEEVLNDGPKDHWLQLRSKERAHKNVLYVNAQEYYKDRYQKAPRIKEKLYLLHGDPVPTGRELVCLDLTDNRGELLSVNLGLYGNNSWITGPRKESSIEFIAKPCSWPTQIVDVSLNSLVLMMRRPSVLQKIMKHIYNNPASISYMPMVIDTVAKDVDATLMQQVLEDYDAGDMYEKYQKELAELEVKASAGLVQLMIPQEKAKRWCYVSRMLGAKAADYSIMTLQEEKKDQLPYSQARIVLHPDIISYDHDNKQDNTIMHCYLLMKPEELSHMINRMYAIAQEIKKAHS